MKTDVESPPSAAFSFTGSRRTVNRSGRQSKIYSVAEVLKKQESLKAQHAKQHEDPNEWEMGDPCNADTPFGRFRDKCGAFVNHPYVSNSTIFLIVVNSILMGVMTFDFVKDDPKLEGQLDIFDTAILAVFTVEFALQAIYLGWATLKNAWLVFDGSIAFFSWAFMGSSVKILRSFRIFRIFALVARMESLRTLFTAVTSTIPQMGSIWLILSMFFYVFAVLFTNLYAELYDEGFLDWDYFGRLDRTIITLFQFMTLDSWTGVVRQVMDARPLSFLGFFFFVLISAFIILSLMIAVVCESLIETNEAKKEANEKDARDAEDAEDELRARAYPQTPDSPMDKGLVPVEDLIRHLSSQNDLVTAQEATQKTVKDIQENLERVEEDMQESLAVIRDELVQTQAEVKDTLKAILSKLS